MSSSLLFFVELLIAGSRAADGAGLLFASGAKKQIRIILIASAVQFDWSWKCRKSLEPQQ
jgi:hypothetical protein